MYEYVNGTLAGEDIMYFFTYANSVTGNLFGFFTVLAFFLVLLIGSLIMQQRFTNRMRFEVSLAAASFATLGFALILEQRTGVLGAGYFIILVILAILSVLWLALSTE